MKIKMFHVKHYPPGMNIAGERVLFVVGLVISFLYSTTFLWRYVLELSSWYSLSGVNMMEGKFVMASFLELLGNGLVGFRVMAIAVFSFSILHYIYFEQGSKSIYLMKRLPDGKELYKRMS